jgi:hypothetical protein
VEGSCEHGNEPSGTIKYLKILQLLRDWRFLKKGSASWSLLVNAFSQYKFPMNCGLRDHKLTPRSKIDFETLTVVQLGKIFTKIYGIIWVITAFTTACHWFLISSSLCMYILLLKQQNEVTINICASLVRLQMP